MNIPSEFKEMFHEDLKCIDNALADILNNETPEVAKFDLYKELTGRYHTIIPRLGDGLYNYIKDYGFYDDVSGESLIHNLKLLKSKMKAFKALGYPISSELINSKKESLIVNANYSSHNENSNVNTNENINEIDMKFSTVRERIYEMSALSEEQIKDIISNVDRLEEIVKSNDRKSLKWEKAKDIIKWIADKGVDVGIALLPLLLTIS